MTHRYPTPEGFKQALETRIRRAATERAIDMGRFRQLLVFDRFLARVFRELSERVIIKGGVVLELRLQRARTTRDVDLRMTGNPKDLLESLQRAGRVDLDDYLTFEIAPDAIHPSIEGEGIVYEGQRFRAEARLAGKHYGMPFGVDAAFGDILTLEPDVVNGSDFFEFIGIQPSQFRIYPRETHIAEKIHAYTLPRTRENTRVKDLPDIALLAQAGSLGAVRLREAIQQTFKFRGSHPVPLVLPPAPNSWAPVYARMAREDGLPWSTIAEVEDLARRFVEPVLGSEMGDWNPEPGVWR